MRLLDLFSGIGGFSLAARWAGGFETIGFCEIDSYCQKVLQKNFPGVPIHDDIKTLQGTEFGPVDIITGGFPCQPFSFAGKRKGKADDRDLWPQMFSIIKNAKPRWVIGENVNGFINVGFERTALNLEAEGYEVQALVIPAYAVKAPHRRDRLWILAHRRERGRSAESELKQKDRSPILDSSGPGNVADAKSDEQRRTWPTSGEQQIPIRGRSPQSSEILSEAHCNNQQWGSRSLQMGRKWSEGTITENGFTGGTQWSIEPSLGRVAHGIPARVDRLKGLGNAIVPQVAFQILKGIKEIEEQNEHT